MVEKDKCYYRQRAYTEMERAREATVPEAVDVHHRLARAYLDKLLQPRPKGGRIRD